jgi:hypothetical protein
MARHQNIRIAQRETFSLTTHWTNPDGTPKDLTGYTAMMQIRQTVDSEDDEITLTDEDGITITGEEGRVDVVIQADETAAMDFESGVYDLFLMGDGVSTRLLKGKVAIDKAVTRE